MENMEKIQELNEQWDELTATIQRLRDERQQIDDWIFEAVSERLDVVRELEQLGAEIDFG
jgi:uncharacterized coiled-coil DUF342 family protein